ncbi:hypothetical protein [Bacterioplanoides sp.]|uniref:hypothetical protein n=1 Tax=Bacterioplanoides sp. TaxID=2066072 RepID=UPI003AFFB07A
MNIGSTTGSAFTTASAGISQGTDQVRRAAQDVVDATTERPVEGPDQLAQAATDLKEGERSVEANARVLEAEDRTLGSIIDIQA